MYGMIHRAIQQMANDTGDASLWPRIAAAAGVDDTHLISASSYDDDVTLRIIGGACEVMNTEPDALLEAFGEYWIGYAVKGPYGALMNLTGQDILTFLDNLDRLHQSVQSAMPSARLPGFAARPIAEGVIEVVYSSERAGLETFVTGLLKGVVSHFNHTGSVERGAVTNQGVEFIVRLDRP
jgi:Haem-NO-binding